MRTKAVVITAAAAAAIALAGCGASSTPAQPFAAASTTPAAVTADPVSACLQLHQWKISNADGVSPALQRKLAAETKGTPLGIDVTQWEQDLAASGGQSSSSAADYISTLLEDAQAVADDCAALGVRNTLG